MLFDGAKLNNHFETSKHLSNFFSIEYNFFWNVYKKRRSSPLILGRPEIAQMRFSARQRHHFGNVLTPSM